MHYLSVYSACLGEEFELVALPFIAAINAHSPGTTLHLDIINPTPECHRLMTSVKRQATALSLSFSLSRLTQSTTLSALIAGRFGDYLKRAYCNVLYLDIHLITQKPLFTFLSLYHDKDIAYFSSASHALLPTVFWCHPSRKIIKALMSLGHYLFSDWLTKNMRFDSVPITYSLYDSLFRSDLCQAEKQKLGKVLLASKSIAIVARRIDLPFHRGILPTRQRAIRNLQTETRLYWQAFTLLLKAAYENQNMLVDIICVPHPQITEDFIKRLPYALIYIPHMNHHQIQDERAYFYMQDIYPWFFSIDKKGWGPTHSKRGSKDYLLSKPTPQLNEFVSFIKQHKKTKYKQTRCTLPQFEVFCPLQMPKDESIQYGLDYPFFKLIECIYQWAITYRVKVLFKSHPMAQQAYPGCLNQDTPYTQLIHDGDIHSLIQQARVLFVANSSVGLEALLYNKPIVSFARSIYDQLTIQSNLNIAHIQRHYLTAIQQSRSYYQTAQWLYWYFFESGCMLNTTHLNIKLHHGKRSCLKSVLPSVIREQLKVQHYQTTHSVKNICALSPHSILKLCTDLLQHIRFELTSP